MIILVVVTVVVLLAAGLLVIYRKNKQVKVLNEELIKRNRNMAVQRDKIELQNMELANLNHSKDQLFSVVGHDLRSPILSIMQTVDMLRSNDLSAAETRMVLDNFFEKLTATATMLDNLLLWVQDQKKEIRTDKLNFLLPSVTDQVLMVLTFQAREKNISIQHESHPDARVYADRNHVRIIFQNLISNAIKFTPANGRIFIHYFTDERKSGIVIRDTGIGIPKDKIPLLFRVMGKDISTYGTAHEKGIGIGLMLVKKYADENQAEIVVNSTSAGTEFVVVLNRNLS
ncbi:Adaptive-response sensory-kinase SasA [compost metagenome]